MVVLSHEEAQRLYGEHYLALRYEDLLEAPEHWMRLVWDLLGAGAFAGAREAIQAEMVRNPAAEWHRTKEPGLTRHLPRGVPGGWRAVFTEEDRRLFETVAGDVLAAWGYDVQA